MKALNDIAILLNREEEIFSEDLDFDRYKIEEGNIVFLNLSGLEISNLQQLIFSELSDLKELNLSDNNLTELDSNIFNALINLEGLSLNNNDLVKLPEELFKYNNKIKRLNFQNNKLNSIPHNIFMNTPNIEILFVNSNDISEIPISITKLSSLKLLNFMDNKNLDKRSQDIFVKTKLDKFKIKILKQYEINLEQILNEFRKFIPCNTNEELIKYLSKLNNNLNEVIQKLNYIQDLFSIGDWKEIDKLNLNDLGILNGKFLALKKRSFELKSKMNQFRNNFPQIDEFLSSDILFKFNRHFNDLQNYTEWFGNIKENLLLIHKKTSLDCKYNDLPNIIAYKKRELANSINYEKSYEIILESAEIITWYIALIILSINSKFNFDNINNKLRDAFKTNLRSFSWGDWYNFLYELNTKKVKYGIKNSIFKPIIVNFGNNELKLIRELKSIRNDKAHLRGPRVLDEYKKAVAKSKKDLDEIIDKTVFLSDFPLVYIEKVETNPFNGVIKITVRKFIGTSLIYEIENFEFTTVNVPDSLPIQNYLYLMHIDKGKFFFELISPLIIYSSCDKECGKESLLSIDTINLRKNIIIYKEMLNGSHTKEMDFDFTKMALNKFNFNL